MKFITPRKAFIFALLTFLFLFITNGVVFIQSDGYAAFHTADSIVDNFDFVYRNEPEHYDYRGHVVDVNNNGEYSVVYPPGDAILNTPMQFVAKFFEGNKTIYNDYFKATNGHTFAQGLGFLVTGNIFGLMTLVVLYKIGLEVLKRIQDTGNKIQEKTSNLKITKSAKKTKKIKNFSEHSKIALISAFLAYASSYAIWYVMLEPAFNHTYELFAVSLMIFAYLRYLNTGDKRYLVLTGFGLGLATLIRPVLFVLGIGILMHQILETIMKFKSIPIRKTIDGRRLTMFETVNDITKIALRKMQNLQLIALGGLPSLVLFMWYNFVSYGKLIASGYAEIRGENFQFGEWNGLKILFSLERGWFIYSPIFFVAVIALVYLYKKSKFLSVWALSSILALVLIYGFWPSWWAGGSYGHRFLIPLMPFGLIGLVWLLAEVRRLKGFKVKKLFTKSQYFNFLTFKHLNALLIIIIISCLLWSLLLTLLYRFTPVAELKPKDYNTISGGRSWLSGDRYTPFDILNYHFKLIKNAKSVGWYASSLVDGMNGGNSMVPIVLGRLNTTIRIDDRNPEEIKFIIIKPPFKKYSLDTQILVLIKDANEHEVFSTTLTDLENQNEIVIKVSEIDKLSSPNEDRDMTLSPEEFKAFRAVNGKYEIYFRDERKKLFFRGHPLLLREGESEYKL